MLSISRENDGKRKARADAHPCSVSRGLGPLDGGVVKRAWKPRACFGDNPLTGLLAGSMPPATTTSCSDRSKPPTKRFIGSVCPPTNNPVAPLETTGAGGPH